jgi:hypothetical protein
MIFVVDRFKGSGWVIFLLFSAEREFIKGFNVLT